MTVPFIMALGVGLSAMRSDKESSSDSFGLIALCSVGPIMMVIILGICFNPGEAVYEVAQIPQVETSRDVLTLFIKTFPGYAKEVAISILPVAALFYVFSLVTHYYRLHEIKKMTVGFLYTYIGLVMFLTGVNFGFATVGQSIGHVIAEGEYKWLLIPIGAIIGYYIVQAEPAVHVLNNQVEEITGGTVTKKMMNLALSASVACAVALSMARVILGFSIYYILIPGYIIATMLSLFVSPVFVGIAFDSGGVASGPMTSTFLLPLSIGACIAVGGNVVTDAFGVVAMVALAPLISIQIMGLLYRIKSRSNADTVKYDDTIVELEEDI